MYVLLALLMFFHGLSANLGMSIIKDENAVFKQSVMLLPIPILWIYHMHFGKQKDSFSALKLIGQVLLVTFVFLFMVWDRETVAEKEGKERKGQEGGKYGDEDDEEAQRLIDRLGLINSPHSSHAAGDDYEDGEPARKENETQR